ncbi:PelD GGDEF domain-containing protein [Paraferrimonas sedimenticola]|uniref:Pellicle/biofilm biosynthesis protein PelD n=1 Tax=Paraferrimonas sedimenticola TaxID=375674 RepID=A0AA37RWM4_9GAMM|nr:PelD GGDEF domain-containing protein [Paraferrimonas sedimenticola]GLP96344.1 pellicle/biofilm biosynthesis protein PelD [Paraferrimonas sedimenticola]
MPQTSNRRFNAIFYRLILGTDHQAFAWFEMVLVAVCSMTVWIYQSSIPYAQAVDYFYWPMLGPVLIALRYGFGRGMMCFFLVLILAGAWNSVMEQTVAVSVSVSVGTAILTMLVGEFRDHWHTLNERFELNFRFMEQKLQSFTQNYHLLKVSHDQLEQRAAGKQMSLRTGIRLLQQQASLDTPEEMAKLAQKSLKLMSDVVTLYQAGFYLVKDGQVEPVELAKIGVEHDLHLDDAMIADALQTKAVLSPINFLESTERGLAYQLVIPLTDIKGVVRGLIVAEKVQFISLTESNIALIGLLSGYIGNLLSSEYFTTILQPSQGETFIQYVKYQRWYKRRYGVDSALVIFYDDSLDQVMDLYRITDFKRDADIYWSCKGPDDRQALCVLLPMTTVQAASQYVNRISDALKRVKVEASEQLEVIGPLVVSQQYDEIVKRLEQLGVDNEELVDSSNHIV